MASSEILEIEFRESRVGSEMLVINGCKYMVNRRAGDTVYWRCIYSWCHSRAVIIAGCLKSTRGQHICPQPLDGTREEESQKSIAARSSIDYQSNDVSTVCQKTEDINCNSDIKPIEVPVVKFVLPTELQLSSNKSFLEFAEKNSPIKEETSQDDYFDPAWKHRVMESLKMYSEPEQIRRFQKACDIRKAWCDNRRHLSDKFGGNQSKWTKKNAIWGCSQDLPKRSRMKLTKPERGLGCSIEQPLVPIKIIDHVAPQLKTNEIKPKIDYKEEAIEDSKQQVKVGLKRKAVDEEISSEKVFKPFKNEGKCPICEKVVQSSLERHLNVHYGIKPFQCQYCKKNFSQEHSYRSHERIHTSDRQFCCSICPKRFTSNGSLKRHISSHETGKTFSCNTCGKRFRKQKFLQYHNYTEHGGEADAENADSIQPDSEGLCSDSSETECPPRKPIKRKRDADETPSLTKKIHLAVRREIRKRRHMKENTPKPRLFSLEELKYADFLQPKVLLSSSLNQLMAQMGSEGKSSMHNTTVTDLCFHNYAKPTKS